MGLLRKLSFKASSQAIPATHNLVVALRPFNIEVLKPPLGGEQSLPQCIHGH